MTCTIQDTHPLPRESVGDVHEAEVVFETLAGIDDIHPMVGPQAVLHANEFLEMLHAHGSGAL
jgi:hypothetical protein